MVLDGSGWIRMDPDDFGWLWMVPDGSGAISERGRPHGSGCDIE